MQYEAQDIKTRQRIRARRRARKRRQMRRRATAASVVVALIAVFCFCGMAFTAGDQEPSIQPAAHPPIQARPLRQVDLVVQEPPSAGNTTVVEPEAAETTEIEPEYTTEQMLEDRYLLDDIPLSYDLQLFARDAADTFGVPYKLLLAVMFKESSYQTDAVNASGTCWGLMQVNQINFEWLQEELAEYGVTDIQNDPEDNIMAGAFLLGNLLDKYEDENKALMCYNCGESGAKNQWEQGWYSSPYSRGVIQYADELDVSITKR